MIVNKYYSKKYLNVFLLLSFLVLIIIWISVVYLIGAQAIVTKIGLNNIYLPIFIIAILSGSSSFVSASFFAVYISIASGIDNHLLFVISGGLGLSVGDSIFYYLGKKTENLKPRNGNLLLKN